MWIGKGDLGMAWRVEAEWWRRSTILTIPVGGRCSADAVGRNLQRACEQSGGFQIVQG
jgi:hypothetical protein